MGKLFILMGVPGSGKSTWCKNHITNETYISRDEIRFSLISENDEYFSKEDIVFNTFVEKINKALNDGTDVFADATHLNRVSRNKLIKQIQAPVEEIDVIWTKTLLKRRFEEIAKGRVVLTFQKI